MKYTLLTLFLLISNLYTNDTFYYNNGKKVSLEELPTNINISKSLRAIINTNISNIKYYTTNNRVVGVNNELIIKLKKIPV